MCTGAGYPQVSVSPRNDKPFPLPPMSAGKALSPRGVVAGRPVQAPHGSRSWSGVAEDLRVNPATGELEVLVGWADFTGGSYPAKWIDKAKVDFMDADEPRRRRSKAQVPAKPAARATSATVGQPNPAHMMPKPFFVTAQPSTASADADASPVVFASTVQPVSEAAPAILAPSLGMSASPTTVGKGRRRIKARRSDPVAFAAPS